MDIAALTPRIVIYCSFRLKQGGSLKAISVWQPSYQVEVSPAKLPDSLPQMKYSPNLISCTEHPSNYKFTFYGVKNISLNILPSLNWMFQRTFATQVLDSFHFVCLPRERFTLSTHSNFPSHKLSANNFHILRAPTINCSYLDFSVPAARLQRDMAELLCSARLPSNPFSDSYPWLAQIQFCSSEKTLNMKTQVLNFRIRHTLVRFWNITLNLTLNLS